MKRVLLTLLGVLVVASAALANGGYIAERAYPAAPAIPSQRAFIVYRGGVETLVVESTFQSDSPSVAWLLPLPAAPTTLEQADPGTLTSAAQSLRPRITHDVPEFWLWPLLALGIAVPPALLAAGTRDRVRRRREIYEALVVEALVVATCGILIWLASGQVIIRDGPMPVHVPRVEAATQRIGPYQVATLQPRNAGEIDAWLTARGLQALPPAMRAAVEEYCRSGWCFLAAQLRHAGREMATPHPLVATFPTPRAVLPMRLAAGGGSATRVDLFVAADGQAAAPGFRSVLAGRFAREPLNPELPDWVPAFCSPDIGAILGNPDLGERLWDGCVITRLAAELSPGAPRRDVEMTFSPVTPHRQRVFSAQARGQIVAGVVFAGLALLVVGAGVLWRGQRRPTRAQGWGFAGAGGVVLLAVVGTFLLLPVPAVTTVDRRSDVDCRSDLLLSAMGLMQEGRMTSSAAAAAFPRLAVERERVKKESLINPYTDREMGFERSPGNFSWRQIQEKEYFCLYDVDGRETRLPSGW